MEETLKLTPTEFIAMVNQTLEYSLGGVLLEGEVASFKINQGKWVFFDIKDEESSVSCFMPVWELRTPLEDGMRVIVRGMPKLTRLGKFSLTVTAVQPVGEGSLKKAFQILKAKLEKEGLFLDSKKRALPKNLERIGVISSTAAAGYKDFLKILDARWGGMKIIVAHTQVQGLEAPDQIIKALRYFNERGDVQVIAILRGGGSADDLAAFNDEALVRAVAASKIPVVTGIGHEIDESLCDYAADLRASTPSNAAELLSRDRKTELKRLLETRARIRQIILQKLIQFEQEMSTNVKKVANDIKLRIKQELEVLNQKKKLIQGLNPEQMLKRGYAILKGEIDIGNVVKITTLSKEIKAEIKEVHERKENA
ncbi:MAG: exodeoxyribonuclease VII large subunit [Candidatus Saccharibacteria bacterium]|nr:exodeoxyribonuclease VII large subunit [Candidatus Saccharibacteria bacterium]